MPLLSSLDIAGRNSRTVVDVFREDSAIMALTNSQGGEVITDADFREQVMTVTADTTTIVPVNEGAAKTTGDATVTNPKYDVKKWPLWRPISEEVDANRDPIDLATSIVSSAAPRFPISFDKYYLDLIGAGGSVDTVAWAAATGVASLRSMLENYTATSYAADGMILTRAGAVELGFNTDGDARRMDLTQALGLEVRLTGAALDQIATADVLAIVGPWGQSSMAMSAGLQVTRMEQATIGGNGPANGYVNYLTQLAAGWGNAQCTNNDKTIDGAGFTILTRA